MVFQIEKMTFIFLSASWYSGTFPNFHTKRRKMEILGRSAEITGTTETPHPFCFNLFIYGGHR